MRAAVLALALLVTRLRNASPPVCREYNDFVSSIHRQNPMIEELRGSLEKYPPWQFLPRRRAGLYRAIIREHELQLRLLKQMERQELKR